MARLADTLRFSILFATLGFQAARGQEPGMVYGFDTIEPSANLTWTPCFDGLECSKLEVPLDYSNRSIGTTSIAYLKMAGKNATAESPSIVILPGGPGGSGVDLLLSYRSLAGQIFSEQYNFISYDPRGVNNSGLALDCFSGNEEARSAFNRLYSTGVTNVSSTTFQEQYYSGSIYGEWCNNAVERDSPNAYYVTTPANARDLLTFVEAQAEALGQPPSEAKLWAYGVSYGTVTGATFASMFPDRVERMILDGVVNADQYYDNDWRDGSDQQDEAMEAFSSLCHSAGPEACSFWGPTPEDITARLDNIILQLLNHPVPLSGAQNESLPQLVTYSDLKALFINDVYNPPADFPHMADVLHQIEGGDVSALAGLFDILKVNFDVRYVIQCVDAYRRNKIATIEEFKDFAEYTASNSKYLGDIYPNLIGGVVCSKFRPELPDSMMFEGPVGTPDKPTSFPILFASNTIDPITPLTSARKMSAQFPGSALLLQEGIGHTVMSLGASICYFGHIQAYYQGILPPANTTCPQQYVPFTLGTA